jgi:hypothetical protein
MKRFHVPLPVPDLAASIRIPSGMFGVAPAVEKPGHATCQAQRVRQLQPTGCRAQPAESASRDRVMASPTHSCHG